MERRQAIQRLLLPVSSLVLALARGRHTLAAQAVSSTRKPDVVYVPTPPPVVDAMLRGALVTPKDIVYDLGCGDGRIVIAAAKIYGARGVGIDIDPERIREAEANARKARVDDRVRFRQGDLFEADLREASVVTLYLLPELNLKLRPKLWRELEVGTRVVSHGYDMGDWIPDQILLLPEHPVYFWVIAEETRRRVEEAPWPDREQWPVKTTLVRCPSADGTAGRSRPDSCIGAAFGGCPVGLVRFESKRR